jgi:hypothetical protein
MKTYMKITPILMMLINLKETTARLEKKILYCKTILNFKINKNEKINIL